MHTDETEGPRAPDAQALIAEEHERLRVLLDRLNASDDLREILPRLIELKDLLAVHFAHEEAPDGMHALIGDTAPRLLTRVDRLMKEHEGFLRSAIELTSRTRSCLDETVAGIRTDIRKLSAELSDHDRAETEILNDALLTDIGGNG